MDSQPTSPQPVKSKSPTLVVVLVAIVIVAAIGGFFLYQQSQQQQVTVQVDAVNLHYQDTTVIGGVNMGTTNVDKSSGPYTIRGGGTETLIVNVQSPGTGCSTSVCSTTSVEITSVSIQTPGFSIQSVSPNTPFTVSAGDLTFSITVQSPTSNYNGVVDIYIAETWTSSAST